MISINDVRSATTLKEIAELQDSLTKSRPETLKGMDFVLDNMEEHGPEYYNGVRRTLYAMNMFARTTKERNKLADEMDEYAKWKCLDIIIKRKEVHLMKERAALDLTF